MKVMEFSDLAKQETQEANVDVEALRELAKMCDQASNQCSIQCGWKQRECSSTSFREIARCIRESIGEQEQEPVLASDGLPIVEGETVYYRMGMTNEGRKVTVKRVIAGDKIDNQDRVWLENGAWMFANELTHTPPDTQERIDEDAKKAYDEYWGCYPHRNCTDCPAKIKGQLPQDHYCVPSCASSQRYDLLRRQRELYGRLIGGGDNG